MNIPRIDWDICQVCNPCEAKLVCKVRAIARLDEDEPPYIDFSLCNRCAKCILACPCNAISLNHNSPGS